MLRKCLQKIAYELGLSGGFIRGIFVRIVNQFILAPYRVLTLSYIKSKEDQRSLEEAVLGRVLCQVMR